MRLENSNGLLLSSLSVGVARGVDVLVMSFCNKPVNQKRGGKNPITKLNLSSWKTFDSTKFYEQPPQSVNTPKIYLRKNSLVHHWMDPKTCFPTIHYISTSFPLYLYLRLQKILKEEFIKYTNWRDRARRLQKHGECEKNMNTISEQTNDLTHEHGVTNQTANWYNTTTTYIAVHQRNTAHTLCESELTEREGERAERDSLSQNPFVSCVHQFRFATLHDINSVESIGSNCK